MSESIFLKTKNELYKWFLKNHKKDEQWVTLYKKNTAQASLTMAEVTELALRFGWTGIIVKRIDVWSYQIKLIKRKKGSVWSHQVMQKFKQLKKEKLVHPAGQKAFDERNKEKSEENVKSLSKAQLALFRKNKRAWSFFESQTPSYRKYMVYWVTSAKRSETQKKRLNELISDSADGTKLKRVLLAQEKTKPKYEAGKTPIEAARNLGLASGTDLRSVHISTLEQLKRVGWEKTLAKVCELYPHRLNLNFFYSVIGAIEDQHWRSLDPDLKAQAKDLLYQLKHR